LDGLGSTDSDTVSESDEEQDANKLEKNRICHANCGKNAQEGSIYCSVECILKHAMKEKAKERNKNEKKDENDEVPPPLEPADPDGQSASSGSDSEFVPPEDQKPRNKTRKTKKTSKSTKNKKVEPVSKSPKSNPHNKRITPAEIDEIMKKVDKLPTDSPIMVNIILAYTIGILDIHVYVYI